MGSKPGDPKPCSLRSCSCRRGSLLDSDPYVSPRFYLAAQQKVPQEVGSSLALVQPGVSPACPRQRPPSASSPGGKCQVDPAPGSLPALQQEGRLDQALRSIRRKRNAPAWQFGLQIGSRNLGLEGLELLITKKRYSQENESESSPPRVIASLNALRCFRGDVVTLFSQK